MMPDAEVSAPAESSSAKSAGSRPLLSSGPVLPQAADVPERGLLPPVLIESYNRFADSWFARTLLNPLLWLLYLSTLLILGWVKDTYAWRTVTAIYTFFLIFFGILVLGLQSRQIAPVALIVCVYNGMRVYAGRHNDEMLGEAIRQVIDGFLYAIFKYASFMLAAIFLNTVLDCWGVLDSLRHDLTKLCRHPLRQSVLILMGIGVALAIIAPGGTNYFIAGTVLIGLERKRHCGTELRTTIERIGSVCLFGNALSSPFDLLGVCPKANADQILQVTQETVPEYQDRYNTPFGYTQNESEIEKQFGGFVGVNYFFFASIAPLVVTMLYSKERPWTIIGTARPESQMPWWEVPVLLMVGGVYALIQYLVAAFVGPELPCLLAGASVVFTMALVERFLPRSAGAEIDEISRQQAESHSTVAHSYRYLLPFAGVVVLLAISTSVTTEIKPERWPDEALVMVGREQFYWPVHGALMVFYVTLLTPFLVPYRRPEYTALNLDDVTEEQLRAQLEKDRKEKELQEIDRETGRAVISEAELAARAQQDAQMSTFSGRVALLYDALTYSVNEAWGVLIAMTSYAALAKVMTFFGMTKHLSKVMANNVSTKWSYVPIIPILGFWGNILNGSSTTSSLLFVQLQLTTCLELGVITPVRNSLAEVASLQLIGSACGELMSPNNALLSKLLINCNKVKRDQPDMRESELMFRHVPLFFFWLISAIIVSCIALIPSDSNDKYK